MDGTELCARFSYITNKLQYCGPESCTEKIYSFITEGKYREDVLEALKKFEGLLPYLSVISDDPFSYKAVEAYWIGNELLDKFTKKDMVKVIKNLVKNGLPQFLGEKLISKLKKGFVPHHSFNVFFVGVGQLTGSVATTAENMDKCRISCGRVEEIYKKKMIVLTDEVMLIDGKIKLFRRHKEVSYDKKILGDVKIGNHVAIHWNRAVAKLGVKQIANLRKYTEKTIDVINS